MKMAWILELDEKLLEDLYLWIDHIPLSKSKKRIERDFSDGVLVAEIIRHYFPDIVNIHNYPTTNSINQKKINWNLLNKKVFNRIGFDLPEPILIDLCQGKPGKIEIFLYNLKLKLDEELQLREKLTSNQQIEIKQSISSSLSFQQSSINKVNHSKSISRSIGNLTGRWVSRLDYEELKQISLQQQEDIEILQAKIRRLEHILQLKEIRTKEILALLEDQKYSNNLLNQQQNQIKEKHLNINSNQQQQNKNLNFNQKLRKQEFSFKRN